MGNDILEDLAFVEDLVATEVQDIGPIQVVTLNYSRVLNIRSHYRLKIHIFSDNVEKPRV